MRRIGGIVIALTLVAWGAFADEQSEHLEHLRMMMASMAVHGSVIPQPETIVGTSAVTINITASTTSNSNPGAFKFTPSSFSVNQGDVVTINISVPTSDQSDSGVGHGFIMDTYFEQGILIPRGQTRTIMFTATMAGTFPFICLQSSCGVGHTNMSGTMIVNAGLSISSISPNGGPTSGGTAVTISGSGFQSGATVKIGALQATNVVVLSATTITAKTPLGPANEQVALPQDVVVSNPDGSVATLSKGFTYSVPQLTISSVTPAVGSISGGTAVTIVGAGFTTALNSSVTFGGVAATNVSIVDAITIHATAPAHAPGSVDVTVSVGDKSFSRPNAFTYQTPQPKHRAVQH